MLFFFLLTYGLYLGNFWIAFVGSAGSAYVIWDRQNWLARRNGAWGESGWVKSQKDKDL